MIERTIKWQTSKVGGLSQRDIINSVQLVSVDKSDVVGTTYYETAKSICVLKYQSVKGSPNAYGFVDVRSYVLSEESDMRFKGNCKNASIESAVNSGRQVYTTSDNSLIFKLLFNKLN